MSTTTARYGMTKPASSETVDVTILNADFDTIDNALGSTPCTSTTRPSTPVNGQVIFETNTNRVYVYETAVTTWQVVGPLMAAMAFGGDQTVTNSTTLINATTLVLPVEKNTNYAFDAMLIYGSATAQDIQFNLTVPSGAQFVVTPGALNLTATSTSGSIERVAGYNAGWVSGAAGVGTIMTGLPRGFITVGATAGSVQLQFAQYTAGATVTTLYGGSWIRLSRI